MATAAGFQAVRGVFAREGDYWTLAYRDHLTRLADSKGLHQIAYLLSHPGRQVHALDLIALTDVPEPAEQSRQSETFGLEMRMASQAGVGELLDAQARAAYTRRLKELREELDDARERGLESRAVAAEAEIDTLTAHLKSSLGIGGRARKSGSAAERARLAVGKSIGRAIESIAAANPEIGRLLATTIKTGTFCCYQPDSRFPVEWHFDDGANTAPATLPIGPRLSDELTCPKCHFQNPPGFNFCGLCTAALGPDAAKPDPSRISLTLPESDETASLDGERKTVTALFADINGAIELIEDLDPEEAGAIVAPALKLMMDAVHRYGGYVAQSAGDGIFALFGAPIAHEDHPQRALFAALRMQEAFCRYAEKQRAEKGVNLQVRVGVNSGEVVVRTIKTGAGQTEYLPIGHSSSLASRLQALAAPGSIAISGAVRKLVEGYFTLKAIGPARIKGVSEPVEVYEVTGLGPLRTRLQRAAGRGLSKFVGRGPEMQAIERAAELAKAGRGQVVAAVAEPGVGKSRLYYEFEVRNQSGWMVMAFSVSQGKAGAYLPLIDLLHDYFGIDSGDDAHTRRAKVGGKVLKLDRALEGTFPYLFTLLGIAEGETLAGMDAAVRRRRTLDAIKRILFRESLNQPLMLIVEDLHWIDKETQALLNLMTESIGGARILLLVNYRPEYQHEWSNKTSYTQLRLEPLGKESADEMLVALLGDGADLAPLKRLIIERTEGNPFFIEETCEVLLDDGALVRNGSIRLVKPLAELKIPPTVQDILASRIDRLPPAEKALLQTLALIGRKFAFGLVQRVVPKSEDELSRMLQLLQRDEFIYEQPAAGEIEYSFKHALTQDVVYRSVLNERRRVLHERIGAALESIYAESLDDHLAELAFQYGRSTNATKAVEFAHLAGRQAASRSAHSEAVARFEAGLEIVKALPDDGKRLRREAALLNDLGFSLEATKGWGAPEIEQVFTRGLALSRQVGEGADLCRAVGGLQMACHFGGKEVRARELAEEMVAVANGTGQPDLMIDAHRALGLTLEFLGELSSARIHDERAIALPHSDSGGLLAKAYASINLTSVLSSLGYPEQRARRWHESVQLARQHGPLAVAGVLFTVLSFDQPQDALRLADEALRLSSEGGFALLSSMAKISRGLLLICLGQVQEGLAETDAGLAEFRSTGTIKPHYLLYAAWAYSLALPPEEALKFVEEMLASAQAIGEFPAEPVTQHLRGRLLLQLKATDEAEAEKCFRNAIAICRRAQAKGVELPPTTSLARLLAKQGKRDEARAMLAEIYNWFTEGFDTADLKDAKALLNELSA